MCQLFMNNFQLNLTSILLYKTKIYRYFIYQIYLQPETPCIMNRLNNVSNQLNTSSQSYKIDNTKNRKNWGQNYTYSNSELHIVENVQQIQKLLRGSNKVTALSTKHTFNSMADNSFRQVSMEKLNKILDLDTNNMTVTFEGGMRYGQLSIFLQSKGYALQNLASLPHISVAGAIATATHGSGAKNMNLGKPVRAIELVNGRGQLVQFSKEKNPDIFAGVIVHLGALGIITKITLDIIRTFNVCQQVFTDLPMEQVEKHFDDIMSSAYSVSLFHHWDNPDKISYIWIKGKQGEWQTGKEHHYGAKNSSQSKQSRHPIREANPQCCTQQLGIPGPWHQRLPHFRLEFTPSGGNQIQHEIFIDRKDAIKAIRLLTQISEQIRKVIYVTEFRYIAADDIWLSPQYKKNSLAIHFTFQLMPKEVLHCIKLIQETLKPLNPIPHFGKVFTHNPAYIRSKYPRFNDFLALREKMDPQNKFVNQYLEKILFGK